MRELIGQVFGWLRLVRIRPDAVGVSGRSRHAGNPEVEPRVVRAQEVAPDWPVEVPARRMRCGLRHEPMLPPEEWERTGTSSHPPVVGGPCEAAR
jgi:hypothetical protein